MASSFLGDPATFDAARVGAKAATLSRLAAQFRVPAGFCLDATLFDSLRGALRGDAAARETLRDLVAAAHAELEARTGRRRPLLAVRSSAIGEDGPTSSFAGQHETILGVRGVDAIADAVIACWRSAYSERAVAYRRERGIDAPPRVGVLVQELVAAEASAIAFSADPVRADRSVVAVNATRGLGERLAAGEVTPDGYTVRKVDLAIASRALAGASAAISDEQVLEVARLALALEAEAGRPVDVECAFGDGRLYLLQSRPITTLAEEPFPLRWDRPGDERLTWLREDAHMAERHTPLEQDYVLEGPNFGIIRRGALAGSPLEIRHWPFNGYFYASTTPLVPPVELPARLEAMLRRRRAGARAIKRIWDTDYLPGVLAHYAWMRAVRLDGSPAEALGAWDGLWRRINDIWVTHMSVTSPSYAAADELAQTYAALTGRPMTEAPALTAGLADTLHAMRRELEALVAAIREQPASAGAIAAREVRSLAGLDALADGAAVRDALERFLAKWGDMGQVDFGLSAPAWADEPALLLAEISRMLRAPTGADPDARRAKLRAEAGRIAERTRAALRDRPEDLARFEEVLAAAERAAPLTEEHNYWIDRIAHAHIRRLCLGFGERLVREGALERPGDLFFLYRAEVAEALLTSADRRPLVAERKREHERDRRRTPPPWLGAEPAAVPPNAAMTDLGYRREQDDDRVLKGVPASAGVGRGRARLVRDHRDFDRFTTGDIVVCRSTTVSWIPLFTMAAAVVADIGGALSHAAVVAREFGVPAVVGTGTALNTLVDGERVEVDGSAGTVRRLGPDPD